MLTAIVGINWGDEGKGRMVDLLSESQDIVVRYQGGNNAGHTVVNDTGEYILNLLPSGILRSNITCVMGNGMAIDLAHLDGEISRLREKGITINPDNLKISDRAIITMPYHVRLDCLEEDRLAGEKYGSTRRGIAPVYGDKYLKKAIRMGELLDLESIARRLKGIVEYKTLTIENVYNSDPVSYDEMLNYLKKYAAIFSDYICDVGLYLTDAIKKDKKIMFEAQLGALRDIDFGIYPYTSSSSTLAAYAPIGAGIPGKKLDRIIGIMKAYSSCVGEGPFTTEMFGEEAEMLRGVGKEIGAATKRPRRVGAFDAVASRYGVLVQGADELALTKLDILSYMEKIPICTGYEVDGEIIRDFPIGARLSRAKPVYEYMPGWKCDISGCRTKESLPKAALDYILYLESLVDCPITYVSVGPERDAYILMK
ncbi:MAG: adenylosuccinate synthase [Clostridiales bacterium]|nr:adenylosuccinate synthase [Clostridiales bacterium]